MRQADIGMAAMLLGLLAGLAGCDRPGDDAQVLFDGSTLDGWLQQGDSWTVLDGGITVLESAEDTMLVSSGTYDNFSLSVDFWVDDRTNSGIFIRCSDPDDISPIACYEVNIWDDHPNQDFRTGAIVMHGPPMAQVDSVGRWNRMVIRADGPRIQVRVNGVLTADLTDSTHAYGHIALQRFNDGQVRFKNIRLIALPQ